MKKIKNINSLNSWLNYLEYINNSAFLDIDGIKLAAKRLNLLKPKEFVFIVSGTNGKGTTCRIMEILLIKSGYRVGVYSSPHFLNYIERVRIQGNVLTEEQHVNSFKEIYKLCKDIKLTYFEFSTLSALKLFKTSNLDVLILEVGVGGRLDATNIIDADISIITSIAIDHTNLLGSNREKISTEKAGIFRPGKIAIVGEADAPNVISIIAKKNQTKLLEVNKDWNFIQQNNKWSLYDTYGMLNFLPIPHVPLSNAATALVALRAARFKIPKEHIYKNLSEINLPGRFQTICFSPRIILDVAHNPHAANYLSFQLKNLPNKGMVHALIGMLKDKDIEGTLIALSSQIDYWYCVTLDCPRGCKAEHFRLYLKNADIFSNIKDAWQTILLNVKSHDTILVCGSFITVTEIMKLMSINTIFNT
ncbi:bifunctional tetrahydrofolate synthase/dihydrofolate synthase [Candidatus Pantoea edessiphila]|uniref:Dihydrofolate synthase/folylpolyglutamate synthase n=1 Tax=Candidatus Pantoea edessiphila TaxID=2044610 RepID=A0A2P5T0Z7_9GAMM|nr:bifunctional tetrahydrofolate synthase/dihydrofolate synthase [Candidatus Pantoea edessiphila]PPI88233.1 bifunctional tetrahydrofolate synthase/dihydrofolate synthase [Candidatus Pantoea edessiphila]